MKDDLLHTPDVAKPSARERLQVARAAQAKREARATEEAESAELEKFDLIERFEKELHGRLGRAFEVVDLTALGEGFVVVKLGDQVHWRTFESSKMNAMDTDVFVVPCVVHPSIDEYRKVIVRRPFVATRCATALAGLYGVKSKDDLGK